MTELRPYIPPDEMPLGTRLIFHREHIPLYWLAREYVLEDSNEWFVCEKIGETVNV